jgi:Mor family transcriptional regulator
MYWHIPSKVWSLGAVGAQNGPALKSVNSAVSCILAKLNSIPSPPDLAVTTRERNIIIRARHAAGVSQAELARQFGISYQRVHQIVHGQRN